MAKLFIEGVKHKFYVGSTDKGTPRGYFQHQHFIGYRKFSTKTTRNGSYLWQQFSTTTGEASPQPHLIQEHNYHSYKDNIKISKKEPSLQDTPITSAEL